MSGILNDIFVWGITFGLGWLIISSISNYNRMKEMGTAVHDINVRVSTLLTMHEHPDDYHFGSDRTNQLIIQSSKDLREATKAMLELVNEMRFYRQLSQKEQ